MVHCSPAKFSPHPKEPRVPLPLVSAAVVRLVPGRIRAMVVRWILAIANGGAPFLDVPSSFVRFRVLLWKMRRRRLLNME